MSREELSFPDFSFMDAHEPILASRDKIDNADILEITKFHIASGRRWEVAGDTIVVTVGYLTAVRDEIERLRKIVSADRD